MGFREFAHDFGAVTAATQAVFSLPDGYAPTTMSGSASVPATARITYAIIRNNTLGTVTVQDSRGASILGIGMHKRVEFPPGTRWFTVTPSATTTAGQLTADVGVEGVFL